MGDVSHVSSPIMLLNTLCEYGEYVNTFFKILYLLLVLGSR